MVADLSDVRRVALDLAVPLVRDHAVILTGSACRSQRMAQFFLEAGGHPRPYEIGLEQTETRNRFAAYEELLAEPSLQSQRWFDAVDPDRKALVYGGSFTAVRQMCGRKTIGFRTPEQMAAERKDLQRELLELPGQLVALDASLSSSDDPIVVQGIPDRGIAMATSHTYLIPRHASQEQLARIANDLRRDCTSAVISALDVGKPCTFFGFVTTDEVFDFGPVEALVYWNRRTWRLHTPGILRPLIVTADALAEARSAVHKAVGRLRQRTAYLGAFGTDGVLNGHRYLIHEINPRVCAGFNWLNRLAPAASPLAAVDLILRERSGLLPRLRFLMP